MSTILPPVLTLLPMAPMLVVMGYSNQPPWQMTPNMQKTIAMVKKRGLVYDCWPKKPGEFLLFLTRKKSCSSSSTFLRKESKLSSTLL